MLLIWAIGVAKNDTPLWRLPSVSTSYFASRARASLQNGGKMRHLLPFRYIEAITKAGSIRKAAEVLAITPSALNRRLLAIEEELGVEIFERRPNGVVPNVAGEILLEHIRNQISDMERVKSRIADLSGERRGVVSIACTQDVIGSFLSDQVQLYRAAHPGVVFKIEAFTRSHAEAALIDHSADIGLMFEPTSNKDLQLIHTTSVPLVVLMNKNHPLAAKRTLRLYECLEYPLVLPNPDSGVRHMLQAAATRLELNLVAAIQCDAKDFIVRQLTAKDHLAFTTSINFVAQRKNPQRPNSDVVARPLNARDMPNGGLIVGQLRGRVLPVASARFMDQIVSALAQAYE